MRRLIVALTTLSTCLALRAGTAWADGANGIDFERFKQSLDIQGLILTEAGQGELGGDMNAGFYLHYTQDPLENRGFVDPRERAVISDRLGGSFALSFGITDWLTLGVDVSAIFDQSGTNFDSATEAPIHSVSSSELSDVRVAPKLTLLRERAHGVSLALQVPFTLPTGDQWGFTGERRRSPSVSPTLALSRTLGQRVLLAANLGAWIRKDARYLALDTGDELFARLGAGVKLARYWTAIGEAYVATRASEPFSGDYQTPVEGLLGLRASTPIHLHFTMGAGMGFTDGWGAPDYRVFFGMMFSPRLHDSDRDALADVRDRCPDVAGARDNGGCPWPDGDADGVADSLDRCPDERGPAEDNGCPGSVAQQSKIELLQRVHFVTGQAVIAYDSMDTLDEIAEVLKTHPEIQKIRIEGHSDSTGPEWVNRKISEERALAVKNYMIKKGVEASRLEHVGLGASEPVASDSTAEGREANRRVEFKAQ